MKNWVAISMLAVLSTPAQAEVAGAAQDFIEKKRQDALEKQSISAKKIEYLKNNKDKPYIINTGVHYNFESLEPASGNKADDNEQKESETNKNLTEQPGNLDENSKPPAAPQPL